MRCIDCENYTCATGGDHEDEARLYREYLARRVPCGDQSDDCYNVWEDDCEPMSADLQKLLDEEEEIERSYREANNMKPKRFVIHATRVQKGSWGESVTQIPLFYLDGNVQGCRTNLEAVNVAHRILTDTSDITHHIAAFEL